MAAILAIFAFGALGLAGVVAARGARAADRLTAKVAPASLRHGVTGGLLTALEGVGSRPVRVGLLLLIAGAFGLGAALAMLAR